MRGGIQPFINYFLFKACPGQPPLDPKMHGGAARFLSECKYMARGGCLPDDVVVIVQSTLGKDWSNKHVERVWGWAYQVLEASTSTSVMYFNRSTKGKDNLSRWSDRFKEALNDNQDPQALGPEALAKRRAAFFIFCSKKEAFVLDW